jgi:hypothetical protein
MSDFSDYPVGDQRNRAIAERLCIHPVEDPCAPEWLDAKWVLVDSEDRYAFVGDRRPTAADAWKGVLPYSEDIEQAWSLLMDLPKSYTPRIVRLLEPRSDHIAYVVKAAIIDNETREQWEVTRDDAADAMSQVWLEWDEAMQLRIEAI